MAPQTFNVFSVKKSGKIKFNSYQKAAAELCSEFQNRGFAAFWVGGAVRDMLLGRPNFDIDLATSATPAQTKRVLKELGVRFYTLGERFGTIVGLVSGGKVEITSFRAEGGYKDFRHPSRVKFGVDVKADALRRDFTINAFYFNPTDGELQDFFGGAKDLHAKRIKFVGKAADRIKEDPLRSLRAVRFAATLGFVITPRDLSEIKKYANLINKISGERVKQELDKIMESDNFLHGLRLLDQSGLLAEIFPEVEVLKKVKQSKNYHAEGNVFRHTFLVLENLRGTDRTMRYAGLFHDLGKYGAAKKTIKNGRPHISFHGHALQSAEVFKKIAKRLHFSRIEANKISYLVEHHMDLRPIETIRQQTLMQWAKNPWFIDLIHLRIADSLGAWQTDSSGRVVKKETRDWFALIPKVKRWQKPVAKKILNGQDVMRILKLKPGKKIGEILEQLEILQKQGKIKTRKQGITYLTSKYLKRIL